MVPLFLLLIYAAVLLPPLLRSRLNRDPVDSVGAFRRHLRVLESATPAANSVAAHASRGGLPGDVRMPPTWAREARRAETLRRRKRVMQILLAVCAITLVLGLVPSLRPVLFMHVVADMALGAYVVMLARVRRRAIARVEAQRAVHADLLARQAERDVTPTSAAAAR